MSVPRLLEFFAFFVIFFSALWFMQPSFEEPYVHKDDDTRYITYAVSLYHHGVFGFSGSDISKIPEPANANAPLYPAFVYGFMRLNEDLAKSLSCLIDHGELYDCPQDFELFFRAQLFFALASLFLIYLIAVRLSKDRMQGWVAALVVLASGVFQHYTTIFMTEIMILPLFCALGLFTLLLYQEKKLIWAVACAVTLGLLTLVRPSYLYLFYAFALALFFMFCVRPSKKRVLRFAFLIVGFVITISPWALRNKAHFDSYALTTGGYAEAILIQRVNYNEMSWPEIGVAMVYWLPDFGDSLARQLFSSDLYERLGWDEGTYYGQGYDDRLNALSKELGGQDKILSYLIKTELLSLKHVAVSVPLALRGVFISKYWGLIGFVAWLSLVIWSLRRRQFDLLVLSLPAFFMVAFHAGLSVSIPRYNLPLMMLYAPAMAWYIRLYGTKLFAKFAY